jgi:DNA repair protein RadA/Sms
LICFGEVGLAGELRAVSRTSARLAEAARQGFRRALTAPGKHGEVGDMRILSASRLDAALELLQ